MSVSSQQLCFDGQRVIIEWNKHCTRHEDIPPLLEFLFGDIPAETGCEGDTVFRVVFDPGTGHWTLARNRTMLYTGAELDELGNVLGGEALFSLIENNNRGMAIHAGLVSGHRGSILLPADSGSGKTSVTLWMLSRGWRYHTDELVILDLGGGQLSAFTRPLNIKVQGLQPIMELGGFDMDSPQIRRCQRVIMIPHRFINPDFRPAVPPLKAIVFPAYCSESDPVLQRLGGAEAGLELMRSNVIARNLPGHGFPDITRLVRSLPCYRLRYSHFDELESLLAPLADCR